MRIWDDWWGIKNFGGGGGGGHSSHSTFQPGPPSTAKLADSLPRS